MKKLHTALKTVAKKHNIKILISHGNYKIRSLGQKCIAMAMYCILNTFKLQYIAVVKNNCNIY